MFKQTFTQIYLGVTREQVWQAWCNVNHWPKWDRELDYCILSAPFVTGSQFILKLKGGPKVNIMLSDVVENQRFVDYCCFPGAKMIDDHELEEVPGGVRITNTITVQGPLAFIWSRLVAKDVANGVPSQTDNLIEYIKALHD